MECKSPLSQIDRTTKTEQTNTFLTFEIFLDILQEISRLPIASVFGVVTVEVADPVSGFSITKATKAITRKMSACSSEF